MKKFWVVRHGDPHGVKGNVLIFRRKPDKYRLKELSSHSIIEFLSRTWCEEIIDHKFAEGEVYELTIYAKRIDKITNPDWGSVPSYRMKEYLECKRIGKEFDWGKYAGRD